MRTPIYMRRDSEGSLPVTRHSNEEEVESERTGLREKRLCMLITILVILALLSAFLLVLNLMLIRTLEMTHQGMRLIKFYSIKNSKTGEEEKIVQFGGHEMEMDSVVTSSGIVRGMKDSDLNVYGSRVIVNGESDGSRLTLQEEGCKLDRIDDFQIVSISSGRPVFSARHPLLPLDRKIKRISSSSIVTNKIRSPVNERLRVAVEDVSLRGNEAVTLNGRGIHMAGGTGISFNTTSTGSLHFRGSLFIGGAHSGVPLSPSPALSASIDAYRLCVCSSGRLFAVPGNRECDAPKELCSK